MKRNKLEGAAHSLLAEGMSLQMAELKVSGLKATGDVFTSREVQKVSLDVGLKEENREQARQISHKSRRCPTCP